MISKDEVKHIARLARIELKEGQIEKYQTELSAILAFVEQLNQVDTESVSPLTGGTTLKNAMRPDEQTDRSLENNAAQLLSASPDSKEGWVKVKAVFE